MQSRFFRCNQHLVLDQHTDSACPAIRPSGEIGLLLIEDFAGLSIADLNQDIVVGLSNSSYDPNERLFGACLQCNTGLAPIAIAQRLCPDGLCVDLAHVNEEE